LLTNDEKYQVILHWLGFFFGSLLRFRVILIVLSLLNLSMTTKLPH